MALPRLMRCRGSALGRGFGGFRGGKLKSDGSSLQGGSERFFSLSSLPPPHRQPDSPSARARAAALLARVPASVCRRAPHARPAGTGTARGRGGQALGRGQANPFSGGHDLSPARDPPACLSVRTTCCRRPPRAPAGSPLRYLPAGRSAPREGGGVGLLSTLMALPPSSAAALAGFAGALCKKMLPPQRGAGNHRVLAATEAEGAPSKSQESKCFPRTAPGRNHHLLVWEKRPGHHARGTDLPGAAGDFVSCGFPTCGPEGSPPGTLPFHGEGPVSTLPASTTSPSQLTCATRPGSSPGQRERLPRCSTPQAGVRGGQGLTGSRTRAQGMADTAAAPTEAGLTGTAPEATQPGRSYLWDRSLRTSHGLLLSRRRGAGTHRGCAGTSVGAGRAPWAAPAGAEPSRKAPLTFRASTHPAAPRAAAPRCLPCDTGHRSGSWG